MKTIGVDELKSIQLNILKDVDSFCRLNGLKYFMCGGSLIGAVRHKGYIPWDDDIDIMMLREDYERFIASYGGVNNTPYILHSHNDGSSYVYPFVKIEDSRTVLKEYSEIDNNIGINIDVFPIDKIPELKRLQNHMFSKARFYLNLFDLKNISLRQGRSIGKNIFISISHIVLKVVPFIFLANRLERVATKYGKQKATSKCGIVVWGYGKRETNLLSNYNDVINVQFEDMIVPIPIGYDNYLHSVYGDYMQFPPIDKQVSHHVFNAWWK